jgi:hypothetical protein
MNGQEGWFNSVSGWPTGPPRLQRELIRMVLSRVLIVRYTARARTLVVSNV